MSEMIETTQEPGVLGPGQPVAPTAWDPFQLMDRLDEEALRRELDGLPSTDLVYVVREGGQEVIGLSKTGVDECCMALVAQGQVIREEELSYEVIGEDDTREALFKVRAARYAVSPSGQEVRLDQVIGVKRQPLFYDSASLDLDAKVPGRKHRGRTYRELLQTDEGRDYLAWMAEHFSEESVRDFVRRILNGEEVVAERARQLNPHWYEAGAMKAARNARFRLIPGSVRAQVIGRARGEGRARVIDRSAAPPQPAPRAIEQRESRGASAFAPTEKQVAFFQRLADSSVFTEEERKRALEWLATRATRQTIKDQIDWLKNQVEKRRAGQAA
ncbi:MAG TPA: hypothetical protein VFM14_16510 [Gemmatimonadales bacterium]|nr:hypothetical protein [Gemmatimonadales bacterium]